MDFYNTQHLHSPLRDHTPVACEAQSPRTAGVHFFEGTLRPRTVRCGADQLNARPVRMLKLFKRRDWKPELIPELQGSYAGLTVRIRDFPCLADTADGSRKVRYRDFGGEFLAALTALLGEIDHLHADLSGGGKRTVQVRIRELAPIEIQLMGQPHSTVRAFHSDLADALIAALESKGIKP